jgi:hypothetical protein
MKTGQSKNENWSIKNENWSAQNENWSLFFVQMARHIEASKHTRGYFAGVAWFLESTLFRLRCLASTNLWCTWAKHHHFCATVMAASNKVQFFFCLTEMLLSSKGTFL